MPEDLNVEIAKSVAEPAARPATRQRWEDVVEIVEGVLLAIVAVATAWGGYHAARWDGHQAERYGMSSTILNEANEALTLGGQQRLLDITTFNTWIQARERSDRELAALYERRFSPEFRIAFDAWIALDPLSNPNAPPGPSFMPQYVNPLLEKGAVLKERANRSFEEGTAARQHADEHIRTTVVLATILFVLVLAQRFKIREVRLGVLVLALVLMAYGLATLLTLPRL